ncbi:MAG: hypothetical protein RML15_03625 [Bacteroidota bacterium]|nr:hypothetical protein [Candidatus Kapabacteria bacterium]MCS7302227.1 hypothetical protein [Candidatus Kapabacteria bacterium]MDW8074847.1 hypothetical protein [Bacteroidota bacterium]MDW8271486.1 hypothetical protein [Bacteroidota bacterium]
MVKVVVLMVSVVLAGARAQYCTDELLLDGSEPVERAAIDTTGVWWAITVPFAGQQRLIVGGMRTASYDQILPPVISPDGRHWTAWAKRSGAWYLLVDTMMVPIVCTAPGVLAFAPVAPILVLSCYDAGAELIAIGSAQYSAIRRVGPLAISPDGTQVAWVEQVERIHRLVVNGKELATAEEIRLAGFWHDGQPLYAARSGGQWRIRRGTEDLGGPYFALGSLLVNRFGTCAVAHVIQEPWHSVLLISDDYSQPLASQLYENIWSLVLHPYLPQYGALAMRQNTYYVLHTGTEYGIGRFPLEAISFTADGSELYGIGCDVDCFLVLNGQRFPLGQDLSTKLVIARRPSSQTFAYSTPTNLFVRRVDKATFTYSRMCDAVLPAFYNRQRNRYEALGIVQGRLYLLTCP